MAMGDSVVCAGILVADHVCSPMAAIPEEGHLVAVDTMYLLTGGCAANVAVNVAKQSVPVTVLGKVGDDVWGRFVREDLAARGVDTAHIGVSPSCPTSQTMILLCKGQDRRFVHTFGANRELRVTDLDPALLERAAVFYLGGYLVLPELDPDALANFFRHCRERGIRTVLDVVVPSGFDYRGELAPVLRHTDVFLPNDDEAAMLTGCAAPTDQARALRALGAGTVVVTMGDEGLVCAQGDRVWRAPQFPGEVVDQTGAGDAFCAGFIAGMVRGMDLRGCIHYGSTLGTACVRSIGCYQGVPAGPEAAAFMAEHPLELIPVA